MNNHNEYEYDGDFDADDRSREIKDFEDGLRRGNRVKIPDTLGDQLNLPSVNQVRAAAFFLAQNAGDVERITLKPVLSLSEENFINKAHQCAAMISSLALNEMIKDGKKTVMESDLIEYAKTYAEQCYIEELYKRNVINADFNEDGVTYSLTDNGIKMFPTLMENEIRKNSTLVHTLNKLPTEQEWKRIELYRQQAIDNRQSGITNSESVLSILEEMLAAAPPPPTPKRPWWKFWAK